MKHKKNSKNLLVSLILLLLFAALAIGVLCWERQSSAAPSTTESQPPSTGAATLPLLPQPPTTVPPETTLPQYEARQLRFLLVGRDWHAEGENGRSDTMILCSVDTGTKTVTMISFLRDLYLKIPGYGSNRLNASYSWGGAELLKQTLEENFQVRVDVTLEIDFDGFENLIDLLGGVDIELTDQEAKYLNDHYDWSLTGGISHLDGAQALAYARIRYLDSDFVRTERQRRVLMALMANYQDASLQEMLQATDAFLDQSTSDHTDEELLGYALELYTMLGDYEVVNSRIPADGTYTYETIHGMSVIEADLEANQQLLAQLLQ